MCPLEFKRAFIAMCPSECKSNMLKWGTERRTFSKQLEIWKNDAPAEQEDRNKVAKRACKLNCVIACT